MKKVIFKDGYRFYGQGFVRIFEPKNTPVEVTEAIAAKAIEDGAAVVATDKPDAKSAPDQHKDNNSNKTPKE